MKDRKSKIVADGPQRYREARDYAAIRRRVFTEVAQRYAEAKQKASFWRRLWIEVKIRREVSAELEKEFPPGSLHAAASLK